MKKGAEKLIIFSVFLIFLLTRLVSADCADNQTIMRLYSSNNSHGALWDNADYAYKICYSDIFQEQGNGNHTCTGTNRIIRLYSPINSHASINDENYNIDVCYGNLLCTARGNCASDEKIVVRLFQNTNSHISNASDENYPVKICCKPGIVSSINGLHWEDMAGNPTNTARTGGRVRAVVPGANLAGKNINYEIYKDVRWWVDDKLAETNSKGDLIWIAGKNSSGVLEGGNYYFKAKVNDEWISSQGESYGILNVSAGTNLAPFTFINSPIDRQIYIMGESLNFTQSSYDIDSLFNYTWDLGDGTIKRGDIISKTNYNFVYSYNTAGQKDIILTAVDDEGLSSRAKTSILVVNSSSFILAYIDSPKWGESVFSNTVRFNSSSTYAVNVTINSSGIEKIECIAGNCPSQTGCSPIGCIPITGTPNTAGFENIYFEWTFDNSPLSKRSGNGISGAVLTHPFSSFGQHTAVLKARLNAESTTNTKWYNYFNDPNPQCANIDSINYWIYQNEIPSRTIASFDDCHRDSVASGSSKDCCPVGYDCVDNHCIYSGKNFCSDLKTQSECTGFSQDLASYDIESKTEEGYCSPGATLASWQYDSADERVYCGNITGNCKCVWNGTCNSRYDIITSCSDETLNIAGSCSFAISEATNCSAGYKLLKWQATWSGGSGEDSQCSDGEKRMPCPVQLDFFSNISVIAAIILIIIFYIIIKRKRK